MNELNLPHTLPAYLKSAELVVALVDTECEVEPCISAVDDLMVPKLCTVRERDNYLKEVRVLRLALHYVSVHLDLYLPAFLLVVGDVPAGEPRLPLPVLQENEPYLEFRLRVLSEKVSLPFYQSINCNSKCSL